MYGVIFAALLGIIWFIALINAPLVTILVTFLILVVGGSVSNGGNGDGRYGRY